MIQLTTTNQFVIQLIAARLTAIVTHYASCLATSPKAMQYVADEMKLSPQQAASLQIGFADRSLGTLIPSKQVKTGREIRDALLALGIYKANGRETLRGYVTVPIRDEQGTIIGIRGHKVDRHCQGEAVVEVGERREGNSFGHREHAEEITSHCTGARERQGASRRFRYARR